MRTNINAITDARYAAWLKRETEDQRQRAIAANRAVTPERAAELRRQWREDWAHHVERLNLSPEEIAEMLVARVSSGEAAGA